MVIRIFTGENRKAANEEIKRILGEGYEVFEGAEIAPNDLMNIFLGTSLLSEKRKILVKDLSENKESFLEFSEKLEEFLKTDAEVIIFETKLDKRTTAFKEIKKNGIVVREFKDETGKVDVRQVFGIYDMAMRNGKRAVEELEKIETKEDPYMFFGVLASQAIKRFEAKPEGKKEKRVLKELSNLDKLMKTSSLEPWTLIKGFLIRLSSL